MANIGDQQKRRVAVFNRQGAGVILGLFAGCQHDLIPGAGATFGVPGAGLKRVLRQQIKLVGVFLDALG
ncbi:MAG: hypothetical protein NWT00_01315 [Beijerinckiaceae bacterium]|jgi:hypothetical protein|nr:hypothetical protein [Beijerinckiaceae bacterium]